MEFTFKSKFDLEEVVWFMYENKPVQGIVNAINYQRRESVDTAREHKNIFQKIKSFIDKKKVDVRLIYELDMVKNDGEFISCTHYKKEYNIFKTKEELLKSL
ncbi:MAG: hypothetical protein IKY94_11350 [Lachnospiraceae bacterium]|nr:hypothetical protein [Lachnospiraceae bacterium]